jgi:integrase
MAMKEESQGYWRGDLWHEGRRVKLTFYGGSKEAKAYEARKRLEAQKGGLVNVRDVPTFEDFVEHKYKPAAQSELRKSTWSVRRYNLETLKKHFGQLRLTKIETDHVERFKRARLKAVGKVAINNELKCLSVVLNYARELKVPRGTPLIKFFKTSRKKGNVQFFTREEVGFILAACTERSPSFLPLLTFLFETGSRKSEALNLKWSNVRLDRKLIQIWSAVEGDDDNEDEDDIYEVKSRDREVPISDRLLRVLKEQKLKGLSREWVFPVRQQNTGRTKGERYESFPKHTWAIVLERATELARKPDPEARSIQGGPHKCRHTYASYFLANEPDLFQLGRVLGHSSSQVTELYSHLLPDHLEKLRNVVTFEAAEVATQ